MYANAVKALCKIEIFSLFILNPRNNGVNVNATLILDHSDTEKVYH